MLSWERTPSLTPMQRSRAWVEVNLTALRHNVAQIKAQLGSHTDLMAVVKADAYGHGSVMIAQEALQAGATWLGVATVPEGIELRQAGVQAPILVMGAINSTEEIQGIAQWQLQPTLVKPKQALIFSEVLSQMALASPVPVHLKLDTGMSRLGFPWDSAVEFIGFVRRLPHLAIASVYSHLATADSADQTTLRQQQQRFSQALKQLKAEALLPPRWHLANSAATLTDADLHYHMVRVGLAIYGLYPAPHLQSGITLYPVMQVKARVTHVKDIAAGTGVSYGHQFIADRPRRIAVVGIGYADGVPRALSNQMSVLIRGQRVRQIGAITMDQLMLDVTDVPNLQEGDIVTLLGQDGQQSISADDWASRVNTISWEILCGFKHRLPRVAVERSLLSTSAIHSS